MRGNFSHVLAFSQVDNYVVVLDPVHSHLDVSLRIHPHGPEKTLPVDVIALDFALHDNAEIVKIEYPVDKTFTSHAITNHFPGCVTLCKGLLGVAEWVFTPWQFYQWLLENGGEPFTKEKQEALITEMVGRNLSDAEKRNIFRYLERSARHG